MDFINELLEVKSKWSEYGDLSFKKILLDSISFFKVNSKILILPYFLMLAGLVFSQNTNLIFQIDFGYYLLPIKALFSILIFVVLLQIILAKLLVDKFLFKTIFSNHQLWIKVIAASLLLILVIGVSCFLVVPAVYCFIVFSYYIPELLLTNNSTIGSLKKSREIYQGNFLLGCYLYIAPFVMSFVTLGILFYFHFYNDFITLLIMPAISLFFIVMYLNLYLELKSLILVRK